MKTAIVMVALILLASLFILGCEKSAANITSVSPDEQLFIDSDACQGCGQCYDTCPHQAILFTGGKATIIQSKCQHCGECTKVCPRDAIH